MKSFEKLGGATAESPALGRLLEYLAHDSRLASEIPNTSPTGSELPEGLVRTHRLEYLVTTGEAATTIEDDVFTSLATSVIENSKQALTVAGALVRVAAALSAAQIPFIAYKGVALAAQAYGVLDARGSGDLDILVADANVRAAQDVLFKLGFTNAFRLRVIGGRPWRWYSRLHKELPYSDNKVDIDLHWRLTGPAGVTPSFEQLYARSEPAQVAGQAYRTLCLDDALTVAALAFHTDGRRSIRQLTDVSRLLVLGAKPAAGYSRQILSAIAPIIAAARKGPSAYVEVLTSAKEFRCQSTNGQPNVSMAEHLSGWVTATGLGSPLSNGLRYLAAKLFEFRGIDLEPHKFVLLRALASESKFQWDTRFGKRSGRQPIARFVVFVLALWLVQAMAFKVYFIPSQSMEPTLQSGQSRVLVNRIPGIGTEPRRGDVIVFRRPNSWEPAGNNDTFIQAFLKSVSEVAGVGPGLQNLFVKRVIAIGGDHVSCCGADGKLRVNGKVVYQGGADYPYRPGSLDCTTAVTSLRCVGDFIVPPGRLFVLGDNRVSSVDSLANCRVEHPDARHCVRFVRAENITGTAIAVVYPITQVAWLERKAVEAPTN